MIKEFAIPYHSPKLNRLNSSFGIIFTFLIFLFIFSFIAFFLYFSIKENTFDFFSIFFILIPVGVGVLVFYGLYDYRNNLTQIELNEKGIIAFNRIILWKDVKKVYRPVSKLPYISINFTSEGKSHRAFVEVHFFLIKKICAYISENSLRDNHHFDSNESLTLNDMFTCLPRPNKSK